MPATNATQQCACFLLGCPVCSAEPLGPLTGSIFAGNRNNHAGSQVVTAVTAPLAANRKDRLKKLCTCFLPSCPLCQGTGSVSCQCLLPTCAICKASVDNQAGQAGMQAGIALGLFTPTPDIPEQLHEWGRLLQRHALGKHLRRNLRSKRCLSFATMFSGSDLVKIKCWQLLSMLHLYLGIVFENVVWKFSCDIDPLSQAWMLDYMNPTQVIGDAAELVLGESRDILSGKMCVISTCDILIASCECADNSTLNSRRKQLRTSVRDRIGKSGRTARFLINYVLRFRPGLVVTENVPEFGSSHGDSHSNLRALVSGFAECRQRSCTGMSQILNASEYGDPVSRRRLFAPTCLDNTSSGLPAPQPATDLYPQTLELLRTEAPNISEYILPPKAAAADPWLANLPPFPDRPCPKMEAFVARACAKAGMPVPARSDLENATYAMPAGSLILTSHLSWRQKLLLHLALVVKCLPGTSAGRDGVQADISFLPVEMSFRFARVSRSICPAIVCKSHILLICTTPGACQLRPLAPTELFSLMGFPWHDLAFVPRAEQYSYAELVSLLGRGFHGGSMGAALLAALAVKQW